MFCLILRDLFALCPDSHISMSDLLQEPTIKITSNVLQDSTKKPNVYQLLFFSPRRKLWKVRQRHAYILVVQLWLKKPGLLMVFWMVPRAHLPSISKGSATGKVIRTLILSASLWLSWVLVKPSTKCQLLQL